MSEVLATPFLEQETSGLVFSECLKLNYSFESRAETGIFEMSALRSDFSTKLFFYFFPPRRR